MGRTVQLHMADSEHRDTIIQAMQLWTQGNQQGAVDTLRPLAEADHPAAVAMIAQWFAQMGEPHWRSGVPFVEKAAAMGMPWAVNNYIGNMLNDPALRPQVPALMRNAISAGLQIDPVAHAQQPLQQGDQNTALALIELAGGPWPWPGGWQELVERGQQRLKELEEASDVVSERRDAALSAIEESESRVDRQATTLDTRTQQLTKLLETTTNAEVQTFFDKEAQDYETEANSRWKWGVGVLAGAAFFAVLPLLIYYVGQIFGPDWFDDQNLVAAHFAPAIALGAISGVLLARARSRDRVRQRARDLSVALGTMFVYSGQIADEGERQRYVHEMGRTVIESFLRQDSPGGDGADSGSLLAALTRRQ